LQEHGALDGHRDKRTFILTIRSMSPIPESLGRYRLVSLLGEGGMGKVYRAWDAALERHLAIKILPAEVVSDPTRVARFMQEARAASALNHPNVVVIHDIGEERSPSGFGAIHYIAMEMIDGRTLREVLHAETLETRKALRIVLQVAEALTAAHAAGIIHRDLKPENIMVTASGYAKVLDFGLAKLRGRSHESAEVPPNESTQIKDTDAGTILGTASYMSPEQAMGRPVDHRTDIFSLGSILYELATGKRAFTGESKIDTLHRIIYSEPEPITTLRPDAPRDLVRITRRALAKDPEERYQTVRDFAIDVRELLRELESGSSNALTEPATPAAPPARRPWIAIATLAVLVLAMAGAYVAIVARRRPVRPPVAAPSSMRVSRVTASGKVIAATISRDGTFVAYVTADQGEQALWVKQMASGQTLQLISPRHVGYWGLSFGPDGSIYYVEKSAAAPTGTIFQISPLGGPSRAIVTGVDAPPAISPDGKRMAFLRAHWPAHPKSALLVANLDGSNVKPLAIVEGPEMFVPIFFAGVSWAPDGESIATMIRNPEKARSRVVSVDVATGKLTTLADPGWRFAGQAAWLPDGSGLLAVASLETEDRAQVWYVPQPDGEAVRITNDLFDYRSVSVTEDGESLLTVASDRTSDVWLHPDGETPRRLTSAKTEGSHGVVALRDGRVVLTSLESGKPDIWIMNADGSERRLLTRDAHRNRAPAVTPDERYVIYLSATGTSVELCRIGLDGADRRVLAQGALAGPPTVSPDGRFVAFTGIELDVPERKGMLVAMRVPIDGGPRMSLTDFPATAPAYSPDGTEIAFYFGASNPADAHVGVIPANGGKPTRLLRAAPPFAYSQVAWTPDGQALVVNTMPSDRANLWRLPLDGSRPVRLTSFEEKMLLAFSPLRARAGFVVARGDLSRDAVLITGFR
jgi:eukaryotic-like serine/threonine-protein kinase